MKLITEGTGVSIGILMTLIVGGTYVSYAGFQATANAREIDQLKVRVTELEQMKTDIAVIRTKVEAIDLKLEDQ
jgi:hypothetical protein